MENYSKNFNQGDETNPNPETKFSKFERFFGNRESVEACLEQIAAQEEIESPSFIFHTTSKTSLETRETGTSDDRWFSFSKDAWHSLRYLEYRFLERLRYATAIVDPSAYEPVFMIADYKGLKQSPGFRERHGGEGNEVEIQIPHLELSKNIIVITSFHEFRDFVEYLTGSTIDSQQKKNAFRALSWNLEDWQEVERLREEKIRK